MVLIVCLGLPRIASIIQAWAASFSTFSGSLAWMACSSGVSGVLAWAAALGATWGGWSPCWPQAANSKALAKARAHETSGRAECVVSVM